MGRPKALKNRDVVPAIKIDVASKGKKRTNFDNIDKETEEQNTVQDVESAEVEESPEEVKADSYEILQLMEELEASKDKKKLKKRKRVKTEMASSAADELLDASVLNSIDKDESQEEENDADQKKTTVQVEVIQDHAPKKSNKKYIGNFEISVLEEEETNKTSNYKLSKEAEAFTARRSLATPRVRYTTFMSQKRPTAAKSFKVASH